ncbi:MAG: hypothetical protein H0U53_10210, partial [Actinobacteria bacterium]|nr:hypothetical protein [Actinomycetota bacterium]
MSTDSSRAELIDYSIRPPRLPDPLDHSNEQLEIPLETRVGMYELQQVLRQFEKRAYDLFMQN